MAQLDESIGNLKSLIAKLQEGKTQVGQAVAAVDQQAAEIGRLHSTANESIGAFTAALAAFAPALHDGESEATAQLDRVAEEAHRLAAERLVALAHAVEEEQSGFANTVQVGRGDLEKDSSSMVANGFQLVLTTVASLQGQVDDAHQAATTTLEGLDTSVQGLQHQAQPHFETGGHGLDAAMAAFTDAGDHVAAQATEHESELQGRARELEAQAETVRESATSSYQGHVDAIHGAAQDLIDAVHGLGEDTTAYVVNVSNEHVDVPVAHVLGEPVPQLEEELSHLAGLVSDGDHTTSDTDALCLELERCKRVVQAIDEILNAMQE